MNTQDYIDTSYLQNNSGDNEGSERRVSTSPLLKIAQWLFIGMLFILPFAFIPFTGWTVSVGKVALTSLLGMLAGVIGFGAVVTRSIVLPKKFTFAFLGIIVLLIISTLLSSSHHSSFFGDNLEVGTFFTTAVAIMLALIAPLILTTRKQLAMSLLSILAGGGVLALFHLLRLFFGAEVFSLGVFFDPSISPVGSWYDLGIFFSVTYFISLAALTFGSFQSRARTIFGVVLGVSLLFVGLSGLGELTLLLGVATLLFLGVTFISTRSKTILPAAVSVVSLLVLMLLSGPIVNLVQGMAGFRYAEVKPSWTNTQEMLSVGLGDIKNAVIGKGPNTFTQLWQESRTEEVINDELWWPIDFPFASGLLPTFAVTFGLLITGLMLAFVVYLAIKVFTAIRDDSTEPFLTTIGIASGTASLFLWLLSFFHVFSVVPFFLMFILAGISMATFARSGQVSTISFAGGAKNPNPIALIGALVCVGLIVLTLVIGVSRTMYGRALSIAQSAESIDDIAVAQRWVRSASDLERNDAFARIETEFSLLRLQEIISRDELNDEDEEELTIVASETLQAVERAINYNPSNYRNHINYGVVYETYGLLGLSEGFQLAANGYERAQHFNPTNPALPLMRARLEILRDNQEAAVAFAREAIAIKHNYADAHLFLADVALAGEDVAGAIAQLKESVEASPENPFLHFQLGLIYYAEQNYDDAETHFTLAINQHSEYANALYFRALSRFYGDADVEGALIDLRRVARFNPENEIITTVIENLEAGRDPLEGIEDESATLTDEVGIPSTSNVDAARELEGGSDPENYPEGTGLETSDESLTDLNLGDSTEE